MESLYKRKMFASMRKTKVDASKKRQIGLPASILDDSDEGSFSSSSSTSNSQSDFESSPEEEESEQEEDEEKGRERSSGSGATSSDDSRAVARRSVSTAGGLPPAVLRIDERQMAVGINYNLKSLDRYFCCMCSPSFLMTV